MDWRGHVKGRYDASKLEDAVKNIIKESGSQEDSASPEKVCLNDGKDRGSRVYVIRTSERGGSADTPQIRVRSPQRN